MERLIFFDNRTNKVVGDSLDYPSDLPTFDIAMVASVLLGDQNDHRFSYETGNAAETLVKDQAAGIRVHIALFDTPVRDAGTSVARPLDADPEALAAWEEDERGRIEAAATRLPVITKAHAKLLPLVGFLREFWVDPWAKAL